LQLKNLGRRRRPVHGGAGPLRLPSGQAQSRKLRVGEPRARAWAWVTLRVPPFFVSVAAKELTSMVAACRCVPGHCAAELTARRRRLDSRRTNGAGTSGSSGDCTILGLALGALQKAKTPAGSWRYLDQTAVIHRNNYISKVTICQGTFAGGPSYCNLGGRRCWT
jgi:hypothetical protein